MNPGGSIEMVFDDRFVSLQQAAIVSTPSPSIQWTFKAPRTGQTTITVHIFGGETNFVASIPYQVQVLPIPETIQKY